ncbi:unnamed protein product [Nezara viridula]|uniref:Uncharacterized protein n=1 Tax=Nezara viridula TaxID=85310 RepID=A0A9P0H476_NEZVI|nr:unnamed protein product [Nezara viridula]
MSKNGNTHPKNSSTTTKPKVSTCKRCYSVTTKKSRKQHRHFFGLLSKNGNTHPTNSSTTTKPKVSTCKRCYSVTTKKSSK